jgi:hypothetical protein
MFRVKINRAGESVLDLKVHKREPILSVWNKTSLNMLSNEVKCGICFNATLPCEDNGEGKMCFVITYLKQNWEKKPCVECEETIMRISRNVSE